MRRLSVLFFFVIGTVPFASAAELKISSAALQRTLLTQLFTADNGRHYLHGNANSGCVAYADSPQVTFAGERIQVHLNVHARLGKVVHGKCVGVGISRAVDASMLPNAVGEIMGFHDIRIERLSGSRELDQLLMPFLTRAVPSSMQVNAADKLRKLLADSSDRIGYDVSLDSFQLHSMQITGDLLVINLDSDLIVR